jgi:CheY-like chemotaxis protein
MWTAAASVCLRERILRLLLAEDEPRVARFITKGTREQGYAIDIAADGEEALYKASITDYDLIILDVMMPLKSGFDVCREMLYEKLAPHQYARRRVEVRNVSGFQAVLARGPTVGVEVVITGAAELFGTEFGGGK